MQTDICRYTSGRMHGRYKNYFNNVFLIQEVMQQFKFSGMNAIMEKYFKEFY